MTNHFIQRKKMNILNFHDELLSRIVARMKLSSYAMIKQVSKKYAEVITNGMVFEDRESMDIAETSIHVSIDSKWYVLLEPHNNNQEFVFRRPSSFPDIPVEESTIVSCGRRLFFIAGRSLLDYRRTADGFGVLCGPNTLFKLPTMRSIHIQPKIAVIKHKIYVFGGCAKECEDFLEVYDTSKDTWETIKVPEQERKLPLNCDILTLNEKVFFMSKRCTEIIVFDSNTGSFQRHDDEFFGEKLYGTSCLIQDNLFAFGETMQIETLDIMSKTWKVVQGLEKLPDLNLAIPVSKASQFQPLSTASVPAKTRADWLQLDSLGEERRGAVWTYRVFGYCLVSEKTCNHTAAGQR